MNETNNKVEELLEQMVERQDKVLKLLKKQNFLLEQINDSCSFNNSAGNKAYSPDFSIPKPEMPDVKKMISEARVRSQQQLSTIRGV